jgi:hypothetical protein
MLQQFGAVAARPAGAFGAYLGAHDLATPDDLSRFGVHGWRLQRHGRGLAIHDEEQAGAADAFPLGQAKALPGLSRGRPLAVPAPPATKTPNRGRLVGR